MMTVASPVTAPKISLTHKSHRSPLSGGGCQEEQIKTSTISIAMATFNGEEYLEEQLNSLANQISIPDELVISDDSSTDSTFDIADRFRKHAPFPVQITRNQTRLGYRKNFMRCAAMSRGEYISFCDQDDIWLPEKIRSVQACITCKKPALIYHNAVIFDASGDRGNLYPKTPESVSPSGLAFFLFSPWGFTITFHRDLLRFSRHFDGSRNPFAFGDLEAHDQWIHYLATLSGEITYLPVSLARYRQHSRNAVGPPRGIGWGSLGRNLAASTGRQTAIWDCARRRLKTARQIQSELETTTRQLEHMISLYDEATAALDLRKTIYTARSIIKRAAAILMLKKLGRYRSGGLTRTFGSKGLAKDLTFGLLLGSYLRSTKTSNCFALKHARVAAKS